MYSSDLQAYGVFKPVGHIVVSFPNAALAEQGYSALQEMGIAPEDIRPYTDREMLEQAEADIERAAPLASLGVELTKIKAHRELAQRGYHWLVVHIANDAQARKAADTLQAVGAQSAQLYGRFIIEELITYGKQPQQSPGGPLEI